MRPRAGSAMDGPGQDSFLDIVANLVGILIILIIVVGVRAQDALLEAKPPDARETSAELARTSASRARSAAAAVEADIFDIDAKNKQHQFDIQYRRAERERVQLLVQAMQEALERRRGELDEANREQFDARREIVESQTELTQLRDQIRSLDSNAAPVAVIEHLPTPMAKTVFGHELHVSLRGGRLTVIPWDEFLAQLKQDAPRKISRMQGHQEMTETLGPIGGYWMKYTLVRTRHALSSGNGVSLRTGIELDNFVLVPVADELGEELPQALRPGSEFLSTLEQHRPDSTTVTVWTYPDSFDDFRLLKQTLYPAGYLVASRPLPEGYPIGASPKGMRSSAQ